MAWLYCWELLYQSHISRVGVRCVTKNLDEPEYWRNLAKEARHEANQISNPRSKQTILEVAHAYERLADRKEKAARW